MFKEYWDKKLINDYGKKDWAYKPSIFAKQAIKFFPEFGSLLDIGTGMGNDAQFFQSQGYEVTATDQSDVAINDDKRRIRNVNFLVSDTAHGLPFGDKTFDIVYSHMALHYFDTQTTEKVFNEIHRVLKDGGIIAIITNTIDDPENKDPGYTKLETEYYQDPKSIVKRYFSVDSMKKFTCDLFTSVILDNKGETYKDKIKTLVRFVGRKK
ncbi:class I SAM-dependent methyltransferase [Candidatus Nomurabacteria bacterium]|nr:class I SAM-dependent methyltransferase [Candidatus Nomurabacteria bacterium]